jgi:hypothetical protein
MLEFGHALHDTFANITVFFHICHKFCLPPDFVLDIVDNFILECAGNIVYGMGRPLFARSSTLEDTILLLDTLQLGKNLCGTFLTLTVTVRMGGWGRLPSLLGACL